MRPIKFLLAALLLLSFSVNAQTPKPSGYPITKSTGWIQYGYVGTDSGRIDAARDTNWIPRFIPTTVYWQGDFWTYTQTTGQRWSKKGGVSTDGWFNIVRDGGADTTGTNDVSSIIQSALNSGFKNILIPHGQFKISTTVQLKDSVTISGLSNSSVILLNSNIPAFKISLALGGNLAKIQSLLIKGNYSYSTFSPVVSTSQLQDGILLDSAYGFTAQNVYGKYLSGALIHYQKNGFCCGTYTTSGMRGNFVNQCYADSSYIGVLFDNTSEYNQINGGSFNNNYYGYKNSASGNDLLTGVNISTNTYGFYMTGGGNHGHGTVTGCIINHNQTGIYIDGVTWGQYFSNCLIYNNWDSIIIKNSSRIVFDGGYMTANRDRNANAKIYWNDCTNSTMNNVDELLGITSNYAGNYTPTIFRLWGGQQTINNPLSYSYNINGSLTGNNLITKSLADSLLNLKTDSIYRTPGKDSIQFTIGGRYHAIKDSTGGSGSSTDTTNYMVRLANSWGINITGTMPSRVLSVDSFNVASRAYAIKVADSMSALRPTPPLQDVLTAGSTLSATTNTVELGYNGFGNKTLNFGNLLTASDNLLLQLSSFTGGTSNIAIVANDSTTNRQPSIKLNGNSNANIHSYIFNGGTSNWQYYDSTVFSFNDNLSKLKVKYTADSFLVKNLTTGAGAYQLRIDATGKVSKTDTLHSLTLLTHRGIKITASVTGDSVYIDDFVKVATTISASTITPNCDTTNMYTVTALATNPTFAAPSGTPYDGQPLTIRVKDNGTSRTLTWNSIYRASTDFALPTATTISKTMYIQFVYNAADTKFDAVGFTNGF